MDQGQTQRQAHMFRAQNSTRAFAVRGTAGIGLTIIERQACAVQQGLISSLPSFCSRLLEIQKQETQLSQTDRA